MSTQYRDPAHDTVTGGRLIPSLEGGHPDGTWFTAVFQGLLQEVFKYLWVTNKNN